MIGQRQILLIVSAVFVVVGLYYCPLPRTRYDMSSIATIGSVNLMFFGFAPWQLAIVISSMWNLARYGDTEIPSPYSRGVKILTAIICAAWAFLTFKALYYWSTESVTFVDLLIPSATVVAVSLLLIFISERIDFSIPGLGMWVLMTSVTVSGLGFQFFDWQEKLVVGAIQWKHLFAYIALATLSAGIACAYALLCKRNGENHQPALVSILCIAVLYSWLLWAAQTILANRIPTAIFYVQNHQTIAVALAIVSITVGILALVSFSSRKNSAIVLLGVLSVSSLIVLDHVMHLTGLSQLLSPLDFLVLGTVVAVFFDWRPKPQGSEGAN